MKRGQPLRRTPLKRGRRPIPARSAKREAIRDERREFVERILRERPTCQGCEVWAEHDGVRATPRRSVDVHEVKTRARGGSMLDESNVLALCRICHDRIGREPAVALRLRLLKSSWESA